MGRHLPAGISSLAALDYRNPDGLPAGGTLVVGASANGVQIAEELQRSGRAVTIAVGEHVRVPRRYRDADLFTWLDRLGILDERWDQVDDLVRARHLPSFQLAGGDRRVDLNALQDTGVRVVGRFAGVRDRTAQFSGSLPHVCMLADLKLGRARRHRRVRRRTRLPAGGHPRRCRYVGARPGIRGDPLGGLGDRVQSRPLVLDVPVFDRRGRLQHDGGVTRWPGLHVLGLPLLRRVRDLPVVLTSPSPQETSARPGHESAMPTASSSTTASESTTRSTGTADRRTC